MIYGLYGNGGFGREVMPLILDDLGFVGPQNAKEVMFVSDMAPPSRECNGIAVVSFEEFCHAADKRFSVAVADSKQRERLATVCEDAGAVPFDVVARSAFIGPGVKIDVGHILCHNTIVTTNAKIGRFFHANIYSYVAHDCVVGDFVTLAPRASVNGNCTIEDLAYIGTGAVLRQGVRIGAGAVVGMGAVVTKDVPAGETWVGNPAKRMEK